MVITPLKICFTWIIQKILLCSVRFLFGSSTSNVITYISLPLSYHNLGHMAYCVPIHDPHTETWNIPSNIAFVAFPREKTQVWVTLTFPSKNKEKDQPKNKLFIKNYLINGVGLLNSHRTTLHHWLSFKGKSRCPLIHLE